MKIPALALLGIIIVVISLAARSPAVTAGPATAQAFDAVAQVWSQPRHSSNDETRRSRIFLATMGMILAAGAWFGRCRKST